MDTVFPAFHFPLLFTGFPLDFPPQRSTAAAVFPTMLIIIIITMLKVTPQCNQTERERERVRQPPDFCHGKIDDSSASKPAMNLGEHQSIITFTQFASLLFSSFPLPSPSFNLSEHEKWPMAVRINEEWQLFYSLPLAGVALVRLVGVVVGVSVSLRVFRVFRVFRGCNCCGSHIGLWDPALFDLLDCVRVRHFDTNHSWPGNSGIHFKWQPIPFFPHPPPSSLIPFTLFMHACMYVCVSVWLPVKVHISLRQMNYTALPQLGNHLPGCQVLQRHKDYK